MKSLPKRAFWIIRIYLIELLFLLLLIIEELLAWNKNTSKSGELLSFRSNSMIQSMFINLWWHKYTRRKWEEMGKKKAWSEFFAIPHTTEIQCESMIHFTESKCESIIHWKRHSKSEHTNFAPSFMPHPIHHSCMIPKCQLCVSAQVNQEIC